ncbi:hypothetical protein [Bradyrhizobium sp. AZCC 2230]|uniref:hypothetical protein n=1 Tax=Bradyrhizobium sp. AZCC 2230 TaxID=3117021 RepID=UPI002FEFC46F
MATVLFADDLYVIALKEKTLEDLRECWCVDTDRQPYVAVAHLEAAAIVAKTKGLQIEKLPDEDNLDAGFVFEKVHPGGQPECWVSLRDGVDYRGLYHRFLHRYYDLPRKSVLTGSIHVDHIFSRKRARRAHGMGYVRVALARGDVNSTFGRNCELNDERNHVAASELNAGTFGSLDETDRGTAQRPTGPPEPISLGSHGLMRNITWPMATKAFDIPAPDGIVSTSYMLGTIRELFRIKLLGPDDVQDPFGMFAAVFRMGSARLPHFEGQKRVEVRAVTTDGMVLTEANTVGEWLDASLRSSDD